MTPELCAISENTPLDGSPPCPTEEVNIDSMDYLGLGPMWSGSLRSSLSDLSGAESAPSGSWTSSGNKSKTKPVRSRSQVKNNILRSMCDDISSIFRRRRRVPI
eukprot:GEMP01075895.1.p1 GENE.GEMP01075895.1~~GEMP01075895.1.p1  ORF type:complete len:104 (+),score=17.99 GEMP01075895.1:142-453(+)